MHSCAARTVHHAGTAAVKLRERSGENMPTNAADLDVPCVTESVQGRPDCGSVRSVARVCRPSEDPRRRLDRPYRALRAWLAPALPLLSIACGDLIESPRFNSLSAASASSETVRSFTPLREKSRASPIRQQAVVPPKDPAAARRSDVGVNLDGASDWMRPWMFVDAFKQARAWTGGENAALGTSLGALRLDDRGNVISLRPGQSAYTYLFTDSKGHYPGGRYVALFAGRGELRWSGDAVVVSEQPGTVVLDVKPAKGILVQLARTDASDPIRDIRVYMPGFEDPADAPRFHPKFVERLRPFSVLRFMDLQATNDSQLSRWHERPKPYDATQTTRRGVALEHLLELVLQLDADPWFCMPHLADDDFVRRFATLVRNRLPPQRKVYVEHSNEVWNGMFAQARYARERGLALGLSKDGYEAQLRYHAQRSLEIFRIWEQVFGGSDRLVRVLGSHFANPWASETILGWRGAYRHADALAVAPYFGRQFSAPARAPEVRTWRPERLIEACRGEIDLALDQVEALATMARSRGLDLIAYEAGQHLAGRGGTQSDTALTRLFVSTNRHPDMKSLYERLLVGWHTRGGGLMLMFSFVSSSGKWGSWGLLEWQDQPRERAPKYDSVLDYIERAQVREASRGVFAVSQLQKNAAAVQTPGS